MRMLMLLCMAAVTLLAAHVPQAFSAEPAYKKPPVGDKNILSVPELRWCKRESIRIDTMREVVTSKRGRDKANADIGDFNKRCVKYRYKNDDDAKAKREVEAHRKQIVAEARHEARQLDQHEESRAKKHKR